MLTAFAKHALVDLDVTATGEKASDLFASVEAGQRQLAYMASGYLSARVPELAVLDLPFSVQDRAAALAALDGHAGDLLRDGTDPERETAEKKQRGRAHMDAIAALFGTD